MAKVPTPNRYSQVDTGQLDASGKAVPTGVLPAGHYRIAGIAAEVETGVHRGASDERIIAHTEARALIELAGKGLTKVFGLGRSKTVAVDHVDFTFREGEIISIVGESGSGKTTLLSIAGCLLSPTEGSVRIVGNEVNSHWFWANVGPVNLEDFADATGLELPDGPYDTVAGYVVSRLGELAQHRRRLVGRLVVLAERVRQAGVRVAADVAVREP